ncbi:O-antigen ligase family protein [bacterium]|nr:O-antigen ligase family protein [Mariniblastus sp.]MDB4357230.1 O-antigen ligase family protein [Mariniblastus sp.]MDB4483780.1 O-antigen ligase family protein [bacterium]
MNQSNIPSLQETIEKSTSSGSGIVKDKKRLTTSELFEWPGRLALILAVVLSPWFFASVENWAQCLITLALMVGMAFWWFETALNRKNSQVFPYVSVLVFIGVGVGLFQIWTLPGPLADLVLGRQAEIYQEFSGGIAPSVSVSLDREATWGQVRLLVIALSALLMGARYFRAKRDVVLLLSAVSINGFVISFFGIIHKLTDNGKMFWFHEIFGGAPFGPFVNRNNAAGYLLMCLGCCIGLFVIVMSRTTADGPRPIVGREVPVWRRWKLQFLDVIRDLTATKLAVLFMLVMIAAAIPSTLSRGGVIGLLVAVLGTVLVFGVTRQPRNFGIVLAPVFVISIVLFGWIGFSDELVDRFDRMDTTTIESSDARIQNWKDTWPAVTEMGLMGSGLGSYRNVHRLYRSGRELGIFVYAENQYFQALVEAGWFGLILFLMAWLLVYQNALFALREGASPTTVGVGTMGIFVIFSQATVSCFDFGLYIASNMLLLSVLMGFLAYHAHALSGRLRKQSFLQFQCPNYVVQVIVLVMFAASTMVTLDLYRRSKLDQYMSPRISRLNRENMDLNKTTDRIAALTRLIQQTPTSECMNYLGDLWMHRSRLQLYDSMTESIEFQEAFELMDPKRQAQLSENLWNLTHIQRVQETACSLLRIESRYDLVKFLNRPAISEDLPWALTYFKYSRESSPIQPLVHLRIAEIKGVIGDVRSGDVDMERALRLAPSNPSFRKVAGIYYLQSGLVDGSIDHLKQYLKLAPNGYQKLMNILTGRTSRNIVPVSDEKILQIIPDDGKMIFDYVDKYMLNESPQQEGFLERAASVVLEIKYPKREDDILLGQIRARQGELELALDAYETAGRRDPNDLAVKYEITLLLKGLGRLDEALALAKVLKLRGPKKPSYDRLVKEIELEISASKESN